MSNSYPHSLRHFSKNDWDAFAGAEPLPDMTGPFIGTTNTGGATVIVSGDGEGECCVQLFTAGECVYTFTNQPRPIAFMVAEKILTQHPADFLKSALGTVFERIV